VSDLPLLVFGGYDYIPKATLKNAFERAFSEERNLSRWKKCGAVPLTRLPLQSKDVQHHIAINGSPETQEAHRLQEIAALNLSHCSILTASGFMGAALSKGTPRSQKTPPVVTVPQSRERIVAIKDAKAPGQMFHATGGQHLNSNEFFQAREHFKRLEEAKGIRDKKKNRLLLQETEKKTRQLLSEKGPLTQETYKSYNKPDIKLLCKWKQVKVKADMKDVMLNLYSSAPEPPLAKPWSEEEELELLELAKRDMPLQQTHLGVAAKQMHEATANNLGRLDGETQHKLLKSMAAFDRDQPNAP